MSRSTVAPAAADSAAHLSPRDYRHNFRWGVINGALVKVAIALIDPSTVMSWFLAQLQVSNVLIGLVQPIRMGSSFILQIAASGYLQRQKRKMPFYMITSAFRCAMLLVLAAIVAFVPVGSPWLVGGFFAVLLLYSMGTGLIGLPFLDITGKAVRPERRGEFFAKRNFFGNILVLGSSAVVGYLLAEPQGLPFPKNIAAIFVLATVFFVLTALAWWMLREPDSEVDVTRVSVGDQFRRGLALLKTDGDYRTFVLARLALVPPEWVTPFYVVYAKEQLGVAPQLIGVYLAARTIAGILSNFVWSWLSDRHGNRAMVRASAALGLTVPLVVLVVGVAGPALGLSEAVLGYGFVLVFATLGAFESGNLIAGISYLLDIVPEAKRPLYLGFNSTLFGIARFSALASGFFIDWFGFTIMVIAAAGFYLLGNGLALGLADPRERLAT